MGGPAAHGAAACVDWDLEHGPVCDEGVVQGAWPAAGLGVDSLGPGPGCVRSYRPTGIPVPAQAGAAKASLACWGVCMRMWHCVRLRLCGGVERGHLHNCCNIPRGDPEAGVLRSACWPWYASMKAIPSHTCRTKP